jgi:acyl carrier protein
MHAASISTTLEPAIGGNGMSIKETLIEIVAEYRGIAPSEVKTDATFREMGLDSLDVAELLLKVEDELHVVLEPSPEHDTIDKLVRFLEQNRK